VSVRTKVHLSWTRLRIAASHVGAAKQARSGKATVFSFESPSSAALSREFESALVAVDAVAFALEAMDLDLKDGRHVLDRTKFPVPPKGTVTAGFYAAQSLIQAFGFTGPFAATLPSRLDQLFGLRNDSVHFKSQWKDGVKPHPSGEITAEEVTIYTFEASWTALALGRDVVAECVNCVEKGLHHPSANTLAAEVSGVLKMLDEVVAKEINP
jgi:hypothetical protein